MYSWYESFPAWEFFFIRVSLLCRLSVVNPWGHSPTTSFYFQSFPMQNLDPSIRTLFNWVSNYLFSSVTLNFRSWICSPAISILSLHKIRNSSFVGYSEWLLALTHKFKLIFNCLVFPYPTMQYHSNHLYCFSEVNVIVLLCVPHYFSNSRIYPTMAHTFSKTFSKVTTGENFANRSAVLWLKMSIYPHAIYHWEVISFSSR